jgi:hypothetical protein
MAHLTDNTVIQDNSYPGKIDPRILQKMFRGVELFTGVPGFAGANGPMAHLVQAGSPDKYYLNKIEATGLQTRRREQIPTAQGDVTMTEMNFEGREQQLYMQFDPFMFKNSIPEFQPTGNMLDWAHNPLIKSAVLESVFNAHKDNLQLDLLYSKLVDVASAPADGRWSSGDAGYPGADSSTEATGILTRIAEKSGSLAYEHNYGVDGFNQANIIASLEDMLSNVPGVIYFNTSLKIFMSTKNWDTLKQAIRENYTGKGPTILDPVAGRIDGRQIVPMSQWPDDRVVITYADGSAQSNFWVVTNKYSDMAEKFRYGLLQNDSELFFLKLLYKFDTQILYPEHIVLGTATA